MFVFSDSFSLDFYYISFSILKILKRKKQLLARYFHPLPTEIYNKKNKNFCFVVLTYKHGQFHWTRGASKARCVFFVLFSSSSFSPSVKGVPLPIGKRTSRRDFFFVRCCEDWTRLFKREKKKKTTTTRTQRADAQPRSHHKENNRTLTDYSIAFKEKEKNLV